MAGEKNAKTARFVKTSGVDRALDEASLARAQSLVGLKGYVTNVPVTVMPAAEVIAKYHDLWHVEKSFRMSKSDLDARPMFNRMRDAIEAHLTIVFAALAVSHAIQSGSSHFVGSGAVRHRVVSVIDWGPRPVSWVFFRHPGQGTRAMVDGSSLLLDLDGVVVEAVQRRADGSRLVVVGTAPKWVGSARSAGSAPLDQRVGGDLSA